MSWLEFLNFSGIVICVSKSLNRSQYLCLWYFHLHRVIFKTVDKLFSSTIFNVFVSVFVYTFMSLSSCWSYDVSSSFWSIVRKDPCVYDSSAVLWRQVTRSFIELSWTAKNIAPSSCMSSWVWCLMYPYELLQNLSLDLYIFELLQNLSIETMIS